MIFFRFRGFLLVVVSAMLTSTWHLGQKANPPNCSLPINVLLGEKMPAGEATGIAE